MSYLKFDFKLAFFLTVTFILMTVAGTISHEFGHYSAARLLGYEARINYQSAGFWDPEIRAFMEEVYTQYAEEIENGLDFPEKEKYLALRAKLRTDGFWVTVGGPLQTMLTGTVGLLALILYRKRLIRPDRVTLMGWVLVFLSLFWLRQVANLFMAMLSYLKRGKTILSGDEMQLAYYLDINFWIIQVFTGLIGLGVLVYVIRVLPKNVVLTFLVSGLTGGLLGYYLWLMKFGSLIMP